MHRTNILSRVRTLLALTGALTLLLGCATPQHTNTLIFGTSTRVALDVSQEPTGSMGVTVGYKRHEAVWMPLLANAKVGSETVPSQCNTDKCKEFAGETGRGGGAAGAGAKDTYSVLATFSGDMAGSGKDVNAKVGVAQYFATGIAARRLAQYGGAAAVGAAASAPSEGAIRAGSVAAATAIVKAHDDQVTTIGARLSKTDGSLNQDLVKKVFAAAPAKTVDAQTQADIAKLKKRSELQDYLSDAPEDIAQKIFNTLDAI